MRWLILVILLSGMVAAEYEQIRLNPEYNGTLLVKKTLDVDEGELIGMYCGKVQTLGGWLVIWGAMLWIAEPGVNRKLKSMGDRVWIWSNRDIMYMYKWVGVGILFIGAWAIFRLAIA